MSINLGKCQGLCTSCIKSYIKKHKLAKGDKFSIPCTGIPQDYLPPDVLASIDTDEEVAVAMLDPITWARKFLDWNCIDPEGKVWQRKTEEGTLPTGFAFYSEEKALQGKSSFNRPQQAEMLRCSAKYKVFRIGRQFGKTEVMSVAILHNVFTHKNFRCVIICPYDSQVELIFERLRQFISSNITLRNSVKRWVKKPTHTIELHNGSVIIGFTAGTKSKNEAGAARGQPAHMLVFDEADYLSVADLNAALATITNFPDATVWMSSTPAGKREKFYDSCHNKMYKEFHFPSHVNPNWTEESDKFFKSQLTEDGYKHEILAEFGEQEEGVYQSHYIDAAQADYHYGDFKPDPKWIYMLGVDWNDVKIGTTIAVIGYNPAARMFYLVEKVVMSRSERTQLAACQRIAELNRMWNPAAIYVDQGFGTTQIEVLRKFGHDAVKTEGPLGPNARLREIVKAYDFGGTVEIHDLFTKQLIPKKAKPFLVENSVRRFEQMGFKYPKYDDMYTKALLGYIVKRVTSTGIPVYEEQDTQAGDHFLDAVNLALIAFTMEKTAFGKPTYETGLSVSKDLGAVLSGSEKAQANFNEVDKHKPKPNRAGVITRRPSIFPTEGVSLPVANNTNSGIKLWQWPGFKKDEPRPRARTIAEAFGEAERKYIPGTTRRGMLRPRRKNV